MDPKTNNPRSRSSAKPQDSSIPLVEVGNCVRARRAARLAREAQVRQALKPLRGLQGSPDYRSAALVALAVTKVSGEKDLVEMGMKMGIISPIPRATATIPRATTPVGDEVRFGDLAPSWAPALATFLAFVFVTFVGVMVAVAEPTTPPAPAAPAPTPAAPAPAAPAMPALSVILSHAKRKDDNTPNLDKETDSLHVPPPRIDTSRSAIPNASLQAKVDSNPGASAVSAEVDYLLSAGRLGVEILEEWLRQNINAREALKTWMVSKGWDAESVFHTDFELSAQCWQINKPENESSLLAWAAAAHPLGIGVFQGPNSALAVRCWQERKGKQVPTALAVFLDSIGDTVNIQQYALSALSARAQGPGFVNANGVSTIDMQQAGIKVVGWDFSKPIGKTKLATGEIVDLYLPARGADGELLVTLAETGRSGATKGFQVRGALMSDDGWVIPKGAVAPIEGLRWRDGELWTPAKEGYDEALGESVLVLDPNTVPKGAAKDFIQHGQLVTCPVAAWSVVDWADGDNRPLEQTSMSFQITCFMLRKWLGDEVWAEIALDGKKVREAWEAAKSRLAQDESGNHAETIKLLKEAGIEATADDINLLKEQPLNLQDDLMSSGTRHKTRTLKVLASSTVPHGATLLAEEYVGDWQENETIQRVAMSRMPALNPLSITAPYIISWRRLQRFAALVKKWGLVAAAKNPLPILGDEDPKGTSTYGDWVAALAERNDFVVKLNGWEETAKVYSGDLDGFARRLLLLAREQEGAYLKGVITVNPLDGTLRNEDNDGDSSTACTNRRSVNLYAKVEELWNKWSDRLTIELPKDQKMKWSDRRFADGFLDLGLECHPKAAWLITAKLGYQPLVPAPGTLDTAKRTAFAEAIVNTTAVNPQGPVGMWSNVAAELFMNIKWELTTDNVLQPNASAANICTYHAWVFAAVHVQFSIDWQKRAYPLLSISQYQAVAKLFLKGGDEAARGYAKLVGENQLNLTSTVKIGGKDVVELGPNWCTDPSVPYAFAGAVLNNAWSKSPKREHRQGVCAWKRPSNGPWDMEQIHKFLRRVPQESVYAQAVRSAVADGWLVAMERREGEKLELLKRWTGNRKAQTRTSSILAGTMRQALREIAAINGKLGDPNALRKITASQVLRTWMSLAGELTREQQDQLLEGKEVVSDGLTWKRSDFIVAAFTHRPKLGQLSLLSVVLEAILDSSSKPAVVQAMARVGLAFERMLAPNGWLTNKAAAELKHGSHEHFTLTTRSQWRTENVTQQAAIWKALAQAINANLSELENLLWGVLVAGGHVAALAKPTLIELDNLRASLRDRKRELLQRRETIKEEWERNVLMIGPKDSRRRATADDYLETRQKIRRQLNSLDREWATAVKQAERELARTYEAVFAPLKKLYVAINAMHNYGVNREILQPSHDGWVRVKRGITVSGGHGRAFFQSYEADRLQALASQEIQADLKQGKRRWEELVFTRSWEFTDRNPGWAESGGVAGYNLRSTTDPRVALDRWAANPRAIGPIVPSKAAIEFAAIAMGQGHPVKSYSAFGSGQMMTRDLWVLASRDASTPGLPWSRLSGVQAVGKGVYEMKDNEFLVKNTPQIHNSGIFLERIARDQERDGRGCILPWEKDATRRTETFYRVATRALLVTALEALGDDAAELLEPKEHRYLDDDVWTGGDVKALAENRWATLQPTVAEIAKDAAEDVYQAAQVEGIVQQAKELFIESPMAAPKADKEGTVPLHAVLSWLDAGTRQVSAWKDTLAEYGWR